MYELAKYLIERLNLISDLNKGNFDIFYEKLNSYGNEACTSEITDLLIKSGIDILGRVNKIYENMFIFSKIKDLTIPEGIKEIQKDAFFGSKITNIIFPKSLEIIGKTAFYDCKNLKNLKLPQNIKRIERRAFENCSNLDNIINIPITIEYLSPTAFLTNSLSYHFKFDGLSDRFIDICPIHELNSLVIQHFQVKCIDCTLDIIRDDKYDEYQWIKI